MRFARSPTQSVRFGHRLGRDGAAARSLLLLLVSGVYYSVDILPGWMQVVSRFSPATYVLDAVRKGLVQNVSATSLLGDAWPLDMVRPLAGLVTITDRVDQVATHPVWGRLLLLAVLGPVLTEEQYLESRDVVDEIAKRIRALGPLTPRSLSIPLPEDRLAPAEEAALARALDHLAAERL